MKKLFYGIAATAIALVAAIFACTQIARLLTAPSDLAVFAGVVLAAATAAAIGVGLCLTIKYADRLLPLALLLAVMTTGTGCTRVEPGYVGILVNNWGSQKGPQDFPTKTGRVVYNPITQDLYKFPTFKQNTSWTKDDDESITFNTKGGFVIDADIALAYSFEPTMVPALFVEFRQSADALTHGYMHSQVRNAFGDCASTRDPIELMGEGRAEFEACTKKWLNDVLGQRGFIFDMVSIVGKMRVDERLQSSINAVLEAKQRAAEAQQKVAQARAEADQAIETARGEAQSKLLVADATAKANLIVRESIDDRLIQWQAAQKWDGKLPAVTGNATPFIQVPTTK